MTVLTYEMGLSFKGSCVCNFALSSVEETTVSRSGWIWRVKKLRQLRLIECHQGQQPIGKYPFYKMKQTLYLKLCQSGSSALAAVLEIETPKLKGRPVKDERS